MKLTVAIIASICLIGSVLAQGSPTTTPQGSRSMLTPEQMRAVAPALEKYSHGALLGDVWKRPGLTPRDRSIVTLAALIARNQTVEMPAYLNRALDSDVKPGEISEIITHLAFYSGWPNASRQASVAQEVFAARKIGIRSVASGNGAAALSG